jgi:hypothetical protein
MEMEKAHIDAIEELKNALTVLERYTLSYEIRFNQMLSGQGVAMSFPEGWVNITDRLKLPTETMV